MLRARNILIIFIINYLIILLACAVIEMSDVGATAQQIQNMMQTAADMALDQVQATDDFFTTGGYFKSTDVGDWQRHGYNIATISNGVLAEKDFFSSLTGKTDVHEINNYLYPKIKIKKFVEDNPNVKLLKIYGATTDSLSSGLSFSDENTSPNIVLKWFEVPKINQLGVGVDADINPLGSTLTATAKSNIKSQYELLSANSYFNDGDSLIKYSKTPLSLGITYINEEVLQYFYMNNMQLLMRAKYADKTGQISENYDGGVGVYRGSSYSNYVDIDSDLNAYHPIHNGRFTLLLGNKKDCDMGSLTVYSGLTGRSPKIEYTVIDMYDADNIEFLQAVLGAKVNKITATSDTLSYGELVPLVESSVNPGKTVLYDMDLENIKYYKNVIGDLDTFDHKYMVVAKVTFYADVIVPYQTVGLRELRLRQEGVDNDTITARALFNIFGDISKYGTNGTPQPNENNYVDVILSMSNDNKDIYLKDSSDVPFDNLDTSAIHNDSLVYTTYFAVTP